MNVKVISRNVGYALLVSALFMFLSVLVSVANGNDSTLAALLISFTITFTVGIFPFIFGIFALIFRILSVVPFFVVLRFILIRFIHIRI